MFWLAEGQITELSYILTVTNDLFIGKKSLFIDFYLQTKRIDSTFASEIIKK